MNNTALWVVVDAAEDDGSEQYVHPSWLFPGLVLRWLVTKEELYEQWRNAYPYDDLERRIDELYADGPRNHEPFPGLEIEEVFILTRASWPGGNDAGFWSVGGSSPSSRAVKIVDILAGLEQHRIESEEAVAEERELAEDYP